MNKLWYLLRYRYGQADRAISNLELLGVNCYSPRAVKNSFYKGKGRGNETGHLFPPYLFAEFNPEEISYSAVQYTPGISGFVKFGQSLKDVPVGVINMLLNSEIDKVSGGNSAINSILLCRDNKIRTMMFLSMIEKAQAGGFVKFCSQNLKVN